MERPNIPENPRKSWLAPAMDVKRFIIHAPAFPRSDVLSPRYRGYRTERRLDSSVSTAMAA